MTVHSYSEHAMLKGRAFEVLPKDKAVHELYSAIQRAVSSIQPVVILKDAALAQATAPGADETTSPSPPSSDIVIEESEPSQENAQ